MKVEPIHARWSSSFIPIKMPNGNMSIFLESYTKKEVSKNATLYRLNWKYPEYPSTAEWVKFCTFM